MLSVITPAFNESGKLPVLHDRLSSALSHVDWEWIVVDDHSPDDTPLIIETLAARDPRVRGLRMARTVGSNAAILCGLDEALGSCVTLVAADLLDPPETLPELLRRWKDGADIVWAVPRRTAPSPRADWFSRVHRGVMRRAAGLQDAASDAAFFLADRRAVESVRQFREHNISVFVLLGWMGFRQESVEYASPPGGRDAAVLPLSEKVDILANAMTAFSDRPLRAGMAAGIVVFLVGLTCAAASFLGLAIGPLSPGWILLLSSILIVGGLNLLFLGVIGGYLWRAIDMSRARPRYVVERRFGVDKSTRELSL